jgi:hypothetical protein
MKPTITESQTASHDSENQPITPTNPPLLIHSHQRGRWTIDIFRRDVDRYTGRSTATGIEHNTAEYGTAVAALIEAQAFVATMDQAVSGWGLS